MSFLQSPGFTPLPEMLTDNVPAVIKNGLLICSGFLPHVASDQQYSFALEQLHVSYREPATTS